MAGSFYDNNSDSMNISELASLNAEISDDFIEQLQTQLTNNMPTSFTQETQVNVNDDTTLFEEPAAPEDIVKPSAPEPKTQQPEDVPIEKKDEISVNTSFDDNFIKKYKAKLNKKANKDLAEQDEVKKIEQQEKSQDDENEPIEKLTQGNIVERPLTRELKEYNDSLDFLDGNIKYSKYVIYIEPQNVDFIEGLTVKERKNLINNILRQQDDIAITKQRFKVVQTVIRQVVIAIITISVSIPVIYFTINASLEATIENHRRSQMNWQTLYKENGKITQGK